MSDKILQMIAFIVIITMPFWAGYALDIDRNGPSIHQTDND